MRRHVSTTTRVLRALIGLVTVWCLGCSAFDPMLGLLLPSANAAGMDCGSAADTNLRTGGGNERAARVPVDESSVDRTPTIAQRDASSAARCFDCGCQSCT